MARNLDSEGLRSIIKGYDLFFIDLWGVMHNGIELYEEAVNVLSKISEANKKLSFELGKIFNYMTSLIKPENVKNVFYSPINLRPTLKNLIQQEIDNAKKNMHAEIWIKCNSKRYLLFNTWGKRFIWKYSYKINNWKISWTFKNILFQ